jgi:hypothetical protein
LRAFVSTSNVTIEKDLEVSAVAEVKEVLKLVVVELVASVIGLEKGLTDAPSFFSGSKGCHLKLVHLRDVNVKSRIQNDHRIVVAYYCRKAPTFCL